MLNERNLTVATEVAGIASGLDASPARVALAWATRQPGVAAVIIGPRTLGQLQDNLAGFSTVLPPDVLTRLSEISERAHFRRCGGPGRGIIELRG